MVEFKWELIEKLSNISEEEFICLCYMSNVNKKEKEKSKIILSY